MKHAPPSKSATSSRRLRVAVYLMAGAGVLGAGYIVNTAYHQAGKDADQAAADYDADIASLQASASASESSAAATLAPEPTDYLGTQLSIQTCTVIAGDPTSAGVWRAASLLEVGPNAVSTDAAWAAVSTFVAYDCVEYTTLVDETIEEVTG